MAPSPATFILLFLPVSVLALPLSDGSLSPASLQPLPLIFALVPFPVLAALKYVYLRFRRAQSIHTVSSLSIHLSATPFYSVTSAFLLYISPYLVGVLGSPNWETTISCRIHKYTNPPSRNPPSHNPPSVRAPRPAFSDSSKTANTSSLSSFTLHSRSFLRPHSHFFPTTHHPRSEPDYSTCSLQHLSSPILIPPSIRVSSADTSPTLMQIMAPVLNPACYQPPPATPPVFLDRSSLSLTSHQISADTTDSSVPFYTPFTSPRSPLVPFTTLAERHPSSTASSLLSINASPASLSLAIFRSPLAPGIPVPKPIYTSSLRPTSCIVLPRDWLTDQHTLITQSLLRSPTHHSPSSPLVTAFDSFSRPTDQAQPRTKPLNIVKATKSVSVASPSLAISELGNGSPPSTSRAASQSFAKVEPRHSWDITELEDPNGKLDVDAVSRALGIGLGLDVRTPATSTSCDSFALTPGLESRSEDANAIDAFTDHDMDDDAKAFTRDASRGDLAAVLGMSVHTHIPGQPLSIILEETMSDMASIVGSIASGQEEGEISHALPTGTTVSDGGRLDLAGAVADEQDARLVWDANLRESTRCAVFLGSAEDASDLCSQ